MKRHWMKHLVFCLFMGITTSAFAQEPQQENQPERKKREIPSPENNARRITHEFKQIFKLSDEQYDKVYELYLKQEKDMTPKQNSDMHPQGGMGRPGGRPGGQGGPGGRGGFGGSGGGMGMPPQGGERPRMEGEAPENMKAQIEAMQREQEKKRAKAAKALTKKMKKILKGEQFTQWQEWETERMSKSLQRPSKPERHPQGDASQGF